MNQEQLIALADRLSDLRERFIFQGGSPFAMELSDYLRQCAEAKPVAWLHREPKSGDQWLADDEAEGRACPDCRPVYTHPQPQQASVPDVPDLVSTVVNDACWEFVEAMPHRLPGPIWNDLKPAIYAALTHYHRAMLATAPQSPSAQANAVEALRDLLWSSQVRPSCQAGVVDRCRCLRCSAVRARAVLAAQGGGNAE